MTQPVSSRRQFLAQSVVAAGALAVTGRVSAAPSAAAANPIPICAFIKFVQQLSFSQLAEEIAAMGFDGIEATVRSNGQILPAQVEDQLPKLVEALKKVGLEVTIMASDVTRVDEPHTEKVLKTAASLGIKRYRTGYYRYDLDRPVWNQLESFQPAVRELAALNGELGITAVYQNHAGPRYVGGSVWDLFYLIKDLPPEQISVAYDIRHATMEGGSVWQTTWNLVQKNLGAVYVKDCRWEGRRVEEVPLGDGIVDPAFFPMLKKSGFPGPISLHVEHLQKAGLQPNLQALKTDLATLRNLLQAKETKPIAR